MSEICLISINFVLDWMTPVVCQALLFLLFVSQQSVVEVLVPGLSQPLLFSALGSSLPNFRSTVQFVSVTSFSLVCHFSFVTSH